MVEGEEEMGSKHLPDFVAANRDRLKADAAFFAFLSQDMNGKVLSYLGVKGILFMEFTARGGDWGGPTVRAVHGSNAVWYGNPAWRLAHALSSMLTTDQKHILIDGFYDEVEPADAHDEALLAALAPTLDPDERLRSDDVRRFKYDLDGVPLLRKYLYQPTLNIDGIVGGHWQEGTKTIIPHEAKAKVDVRMVRNMDPQRTFERIRAHLDTHGFADIEVEILDSYKWSKTRLDDAPVGAMIDTYRQFGHEPEIWPHLAGSAPFYLFTDKDWLNIPVAMGGLGHGGRVHSPNEYATVQGMKESQQWIAAYFLNLADALATEVSLNRQDAKNHEDVTEKRSPIPFPLLESWRPGGESRKEGCMVNQLVKEKVAQAVEILNELDIDMWMLVGREMSTLCDPSIPIVVGAGGDVAVRLHHHARGRGARDCRHGRCRADRGGRHLHAAWLRDGMERAACAR